MCTLVQINYDHIYRSLAHVRYMTEATQSSALLTRPPTENSAIVHITTMMFTN